MKKEIDKLKTEIRIKEAKLKHEGEGEKKALQKEIEFREKEKRILGELETSKNSSEANYKQLMQCRRDNDKLKL